MIVCVPFADRHLTDKIIQTHICTHLQIFIFFFALITQSYPIGWIIYIMMDRHIKKIHFTSDVDKVI